MTHETANETATPAIATRCDHTLPIRPPKSPATIAPTSGASGTRTASFIMPVMSPPPVLVDGRQAMRKTPSPACCGPAVRSSLVARRSSPQSALQAVEILDMDGAKIAEQHHQYREPDRRLGGRHRQDEEDEHLAGDVLQVIREGDEVHVHRKQHELDCHQQNNHVFPVEEYPDDADRKERRPEDQEVRQR